LTNRPDFYIRQGASVFFTGDTRDHMKSLFKVILESETLLEEVRRALAKRLNFNFEAAFKLVSQG
jgi:hypothetical protein